MQGHRNQGGARDVHGRSSAFAGDPRGSGLQSLVVRESQTFGVEAGVGALGPRAPADQPGSPAVGHGVFTAPQRPGGGRDLGAGLGGGGDDWRHVGGGRPLGRTSGTWNRKDRKYFMAKCDYFGR